MALNGWVRGWMCAKAGLRTAYSNQKDRYRIDRDTHRYRERSRLRGCICVFAKNQLDVKLTLLQMFSDIPFKNNLPQMFRQCQPFLF